MNKIRYLALLSTLLASGVSLGANVSPDGDYNFTGTEVNLNVDYFQGTFLGQINLSYQSLYTDAFVVGFNSVDDSVHFNDGVAGGNNAYESALGFSHFMDSQITGSFWHNLEASLSIPASWRFTGQYTADNNMLIVNGTDTDIEDGTSVQFSRPFMVTPNHELAIGSNSEKENTPFTCIGCASNGQDILMLQNGRGFGSDIGLKKGNVVLTQANLTGQYMVNASGVFVKCQDMDQDGNLSDYSETCQSITRESWTDEFVVTFNGSGGCAVPSVRAGGIVNYYQAGNYIDSNIFTDGIIVDGAATSCSYTVNSVDDVAIIIQDVDGTDTYNFKVSANHRFLIGNNHFNSSLPVPVNWDYERGTILGMKIDAAPLLNSLTGSYLGVYQGSGFTNDCIADGDGDPNTCPTGRSPVEHFVANVAMTFDGVGSCIWKEYFHESNLLLTEGNYQAVSIADISGTEIPTNCTYALESQSSVIIITLTWLDGGIDTVRATLSDDGQTIAFTLIAVNGVSVNPGTVIPAAFFAFVAGEATEAKGLAIKYDGIVTETVITKWLNAKNATNDFGGDGKADILIRNLNGFLAMYEMDGATRSLSAVGGLPSNWTVKGIGDFDGDGKADILIRNSLGFLAMYQMNGASRTLNAIGGLPIDWSIEQIGDFNGDGKSDILIRNSSGFLAMYQMDGASRLLLAIGGLPIAWNVEQVGDFDGDGKADILIRNSLGFLAMYKMDGASRTLNAIGGLSSDWNVEKLGDFDGDGKVDILIRNTSGFLAMYKMNGASRTLNAIGGLPSDWNIQQVSDFDGDGKADILIRNANGFLAMYKMDGANRTLIAVGGLPSDWNIQPVELP